jgi:hypothetical protein
MPSTEALQLHCGTRWDWRNIQRNHLEPWSCSSSCSSWGGVYDISTDYRDRIPIDQAAGRRQSQRPSATRWHLPLPLPLLLKLGALVEKRGTILAGKWAICLLLAAKPRTWSPISPSFYLIPYLTTSIIYLLQLSPSSFFFIFLFDLLYISFCCFIFCSKDSLATLFL